MVTIERPDMAIRANFVGPPRSTTSISASIAACHSGRSASVVVVQLCKSPRLAMFPIFGRPAAGSDCRRDQPSSAIQGPFA
jgi:hypothetical protein